MVLGKLPVPGRPTSLDKSRARAYCSCSRCGWGLFGHFYSQLSFLSFFSLSLGDDPILTEILSQRVVKPKNNNNNNNNKGGGGGGGGGGGVGWCIFGRKNREKGSPTHAASNSRSPFSHLCTKKLSRTCCTCSRGGSLFLP